MGALNQNQPTIAFRSPTFLSGFGKQWRPKAPDRRSAFHAQAGARRADEPKPQQAA
jgi:hypothetical protein